MATYDAPWTRVGWTLTSVEADDPSPGNALANFVGRVVPGKGQAGPVLDFPTLNLAPDRPVELAHGMYGALVQRREHRAGAVLYVGSRPTFEDDDAVSYEVHLLNPEAGLLLEAEILEVEVCFLVREEKDFPTVEALREQQFRDRDEVEQRLSV